MIFNASFFYLQDEREFKSIKSEIINSLFHKLRSVHQNISNPGLSPSDNCKKYIERNDFRISCYVRLGHTVKLRVP